MARNECYWELNNESNDDDWLYNQAEVGSLSSLVKYIALHSFITRERELQTILSQCRYSTGGAGMEKLTSSFYKVWQNLHYV